MRPNIVFVLTDQWRAQAFGCAGDDDAKLKWDGYDAYAQTEDAKNYIRERAGGEKPFLLFVGYGGPHFPHDNAPEEIKELYPVDVFS